MNIRRPAVKKEADYSYTDKSSGRQLSFTPKSDAIMVTYQGESGADEVRPPAPGGLQDLDVERGYDAIPVAPEQGIEAVEDLLGNRPGIANSLRVMVDQNGVTRYFLPDEFTVQFREEQAEQIIQQQGSRIIARERTPGYYTLGVPEGKGLFETIREFSDLEEVAFAEPSEVIYNSAHNIPDDPDFGQQWGLRNIKAPEAWDLGRGHPDVIVAVIDSGVDMDHPDLRDNILPRGAEDWDFSDPGDQIPEDLDGHGTHVAGIVAAVGNTEGVIGVAPGCKIMPLRVNLNKERIQEYVNAIFYVARQASKDPTRRYVTNCSWGIEGEHTGLRRAVVNAMKYDNVIVVASAGNQDADIDTEPFFPACYPEVIAVAATDQDDRRWINSSFGTSVDVCAPGVNIISTDLDDDLVSVYDFRSGTSQAAPHAAGQAALIWSRNRILTNKQVRQAIEDTCDNIDAANPDLLAGQLGKGRINASRAVASVASDGRVPT